MNFVPSTQDYISLALVGVWETCHRRPLKILESQSWLLLKSQNLGHTFPLLTRFIPALPLPCRKLLSGKGLPLRQLWSESLPLLNSSCPFSPDSFIQNSLTGTSTCRNIYHISKKAWCALATVGPAQSTFTFSMALSLGELECSGISWLLMQALEH